MREFFGAIRHFFDSDMLNPHGICLQWRPELLLTHAVSDIVIGSAYFSIPVALGVFLRHRPDVKFSWVVWMFIAFIMLCGVTHFMMVWTMWNPDYGIEALIKAATAAVSLITAIALWPLLPRVIALPSTALLEARIVERDAALAEARAAMNAMVEMREHDRRQSLLLNELNHRVKNTLAAVQSIAVQTLNSATTLEAGRELFVDRLISLSATHNLLVQRGWESAALSEVLKNTLAHYGKRHVLSGQDVSLAPSVVIILGMALHELATNAVKYGAWLNDGTVSVDASIHDGRLRLEWSELGGPPATPPTHRGFGSRLLEKGVASELSGSVHPGLRRQRPDLCDHRPAVGKHPAAAGQFACRLERFPT